MLPNMRILRLKTLKNIPKPDYITFSGAGEPTLNSGIGRVIEYIKKYPEKGILREWVPYHQPRIKSDLVQGLVAAVKEKQDKFLISKNYPTVYKEGGR